MLLKQKVYNHAGDNTVSAAGRLLSNLVANLAEDSLLLKKYLAENHLKANLDKFQTIAVGKSTQDETHNL